jgi:thiol-disulfide isomerase/thioredoxin
MKKLILLCFAVVFTACTNKPKDYVSISGKIYQATDSVLVVQNNAYKKEIKLDKEGYFKDTLHISNTIDRETYQEGFFGLSIGQARTFTYLENGFELEVTKVEDAFTFKGIGAENSNYIKEKIDLSMQFMNVQSYFSLEQPDFESKLKEARLAFDGLVALYEDKINPEFLEGEKKGNTEFYKTLQDNYEKEYKIANATKKGNPSPKFNDLENFNGGTTSLDDLKGKYVYIDVWATWCGPCKKEIPYLQKLEQKFHGKNIEFVSISIDNVSKKTSWKQMVADKDMSGTQLFAGEDQSFVKAYNISGIPRFILLDPQGNIVDANALRPSNPSLEMIFTDLGI